jgi:hypothetical protein
MSLLLARLAEALGLAFRHYNASILSFDDLLGYPVPQDGRLVYLETPATIWKAEAVLFRSTGAPSTTRAPCSSARAGPTRTPSWVGSLPRTAASRSSVNARRADPGELDPMPRTLSAQQGCRRGGPKMP